MNDSYGFEYRLDDKRVVMNSKFFGSIDVLNSLISPTTFMSLFELSIIIFVEK